MDPADGHGVEGTAAAVDGGGSESTAPHLAAPPAPSQHRQTVTTESRTLRTSTTHTQTRPWNQGEPVTEFPTATGGVTAGHQMLAAARNNNMVAALAASAAPRQANTGAPARDVMGNTALHWACAHGNDVMALLVLTREPGIDAVNLRGETPRSVAVNGGYQRTARVLKQYEIQRMSYLETEVLRALGRNTTRVLKELAGAGLVGAGIAAVAMRFCGLAPLPGSGLLLAGLRAGLADGSDHKATRNVGMAVTAAGLTGILGVKIWENWHQGGLLLAGLAGAGMVWLGVKQRRGGFVGTTLQAAGTTFVGLAGAGLASSLVQGGGSSEIMFADLGRWVAVSGAGLAGTGLAWEILARSGQVKQIPVVSQCTAAGLTWAGLAISCYEDDGRAIYLGNFLVHLSVRRVFGEIPALLIYFPNVLFRNNENRKSVTGQVIAGLGITWLKAPGAKLAIYGALGAGLFSRAVGYPSLLATTLVGIQVGCIGPIALMLSYLK